MKTRKIITINIFISLIILSLGLIFLDSQREKIFQDFQNQLLNIQEYDHQTIELTGANINLYAMQEGIINNLSKTKKSIVNILATKDTKLYFENPDTIYNKPGSIYTQSSQLGKGSGIIISKEGYIITNKHVVEDLELDYTVITDDKDTYKVDKIRLDPNIDIAILKIETNNQTLIPANFVSIKDNIKVGQFVFAIGNSQGDNNLTMGILGEKNSILNIKGDTQYIGMYQSDVLINPGDSGGPLVDIYGNIMGINTAIQGFNNQYTYSLPLYKEFIFSTIKSIHDYSKIIRPYLGMDYRLIDKQVKKDFDLNLDQGIYIKNVIFDSPSEQAGLKQGDIITQIDNEAVGFDMPFIYKVYTYNSGDVLSLEVYRAGELINLDMKL